MHNFTGFEPEENTAERGQQAGTRRRIGRITPEDVTEMVDSHGQQLSNEDLEEMAKELSPEEEEKEKDEEPLLKCMKTSNLQHILSATGTLNDEICDNGHSWE